MAVILALGEISNVPISKNLPSRMLYQCTKFHACIINSTILPEICTYLPGYVCFGPRKHNSLVLCRANNIRWQRSIFRLTSMIMMTRDVGRNLLREGGKKRFKWSPISSRLCRHLCPLCPTHFLVSSGAKRNTTGTTQWYNVYVLMNN